MTAGAKITHLPGAEIRPASLLASVAEDMPDAVVVVALRNDEWVVSWSNMPISLLAYAHRCLGVQLDKRIDGEARLNDNPRPAA